MEKNRDTELHPLLSQQDGAKTSAALAYEIISQGILQGDLPPGTKLSRRQMAKLTGVSIVPVIEALHRLEDEGLVESFPYFGSQVIQLNEATIRDRFALREAVECQVARIVAVQMTPEQENNFRFLASELDKTSRNDHDLYWNRHYRFHLTLAHSTERPSLERALHRISLFHLLQRTVEKRVATKKAFPPNLHMQVVDGIATRSADIAEHVMRDHLYFSGIIKE
jgi:DNA-binding GntR family transcriptional regulator